MRAGDYLWAALSVLALSATIWCLGWTYRRYKLARYLLPLIPPCFGVWIGFGALTAPHGYVASYFFAGAWMFAALVFLASGLLCFLRASRQFGLAGLIASCVLLASFYVTYGIGIGIAGPRQDEKITFGPDVKSDLVVLFKSGTDRRQIDVFDKRVVHEPDYGKGHALRPGIRGILSVTVGERPGYAIMLEPSMKTAERAALIQQIASSPIVQVVFEDVAPNEITPESISERTAQPRR